MNLIEVEVSAPKGQPQLLVTVWRGHVPILQKLAASQMQLHQLQIDLAANLDHPVLLLAVPEVIAGRDHIQQNQTDQEVHNIQEVHVQDPQHRSILESRGLEV